MSLCGDWESPKKQKQSNAVKKKNAWISRNISLYLEFNGMGKLCLVHIYQHIQLCSVDMDGGKGVLVHTYLCRVLAGRSTEGCTGDSEVKNTGL